MALRRPVQVVIHVLEGHRLGLLGRWRLAIALPVLLVFHVYRVEDGASRVPERGPCAFLLHVVRVIGRGEDAEVAQPLLLQHLRRLSRIKVVVGERQQLRVLPIDLRVRKTLLFAWQPESQPIGLRRIID